MDKKRAREEERRSGREGWGRRVEVEGGEKVGGGRGEVLMQEHTSPSYTFLKKYFKNKNIQQK